MAPLISRLLKEAFLSSCPAADRINWFNLFFGSDSVLSLSVPPITPSDWLHVASEPIKTEGSESLSFYFYCKWKSVPVINLFSNFCFSDETTKTLNCKPKLCLRSQNPTFPHPVSHKRCSWTSRELQEKVQLQCENVWVNILIHCLSSDLNTWEIRVS